MFNMDAMCSKLMEIREISWSLVSIKKSFRFYGEKDYRNLAKQDKGFFSNYFSRLVFNNIR